MVAHTFNTSTQEVEAGDLCELETDLVDRVSPEQIGAVG